MAKSMPMREQTMYGSKMPKVGKTGSNYKKKSKKVAKKKK